jgi:HK97 family phage portal protein
MATKTSSVPYTIKKIEDKGQKQKLSKLLKATKHELTPQQEVKRLMLETKAYTESDYTMPLVMPNPLQTWNEFLELYKTLIKITGNVYIYKLMPSEGKNKGTPLALYLLPSHLMEIVLKKDADMISVESPIEGYQLIEGNVGLTFTADEITHIKYPNPNFDLNGSHLYGFAPFKALLKNIESSNLALDLNIKTMKSGGAFGLIHSKGQTPLTPDQAKGFKDKLKEMDKDPDKLAKIAAVSAEVGFLRLSLTTDELKLFEYLNFDQKQICNALGWSDKLLNNDSAKYGDNIKEHRKQVVIDNIIPDLELFATAFNNDILPLFKNYKGTCLYFEYSELPEMQEDMKKMVDWIIPSVKEGLFSRKVARTFMKLPESDNKLMDEITVSSDILTLEQALDDFPTVDSPPI